MALVSWWLWGGSLTQGYGYGKDTENTEVETLKHELERARNDKHRVSVFNRLSDVLKDVNNQQALAYAQQALILASNSGDDAGKAMALRNNGQALYSMAQFEKSLEFHFQALAIFNEQKDTRSIALSFLSIANIFLWYSDFEKARDYYGQALEIFTELKEGEPIGKLHNNLGVVRFQLGEFAQSLEHYFYSLKIKENSGSKQSIGMTLMNIGSVYKSLGDYEKSLEYHEKSLRIGEEIENNYLIASNLQNIGIVYRKQEKYGKAQDYYLKSLVIKEKVGNTNYVASLLTEIGLNYRGMKLYKKALDYLTRAQEMSRESGIKDRVAKCFNYIGSIYHLKRQYPEAIECFRQALEIAKKLKIREVLEESYRLMSDSYAALGEHEKSLKLLKLSHRTTEEMFGKAAVSMVRKIEMRYELDNIKNRMNARKKAELKYYFIFIGVLLATLVIVAVNRFRSKRRALLLLEQKNLELTRQKDKLSQMGKKIQELMEATGKKQPKYEGSSLTPKEAKQNLKRLLVAMETDKLYQDTDITIRTMARKLSMTQRDLSRIINEQLDRNFNEFINQYRVYEAKELLLKSRRNAGDKDMSVLEIAYHVGFNSKSSFNTVFKKLTGQTPSEFKKENQTLS